LRKQEHDKIAHSLEQSWEAARRTSERLKAQLQALETKLEEARRKRSSLVARQRAVEARTQMDKTLAHLQTGLHLQDSFTRMEDKVLEMEAHMEARAELYNEYSEVEREILRLEIDTEVEKELAALKEEIAQGGQKQTP
jgi:phage shock protein A